ncbi:putative monooxygenase [Gordonia polyisoprenivorans VH2]|uniref:Putative monooxygenase n=1 Tax=Gordonia polyisoprenivorans (strain DSM 44266 / VH2) TaxID=1112204 RepID=H6N152_GORPV|nr:hypothetical protein [Gordonia polyisoprenivorans]AFA75817.1 putative monooxygenase [Gordonia polyisoprenivorans VH2]UZF56234.1 monooxygenase [Gordonia polyisoprenivorans]
MTVAPSAKPVVELRIWGVDRVGPALLRVASGRTALRHLPGLRFAKVMGTGSARTFTPRDADTHHWALLTVWADADAAATGAASRYLRSWDRAGSEALTVRMVPLASRGRWSRREPFGTNAPRARRTDWTGPVAALTRARLRPTRMASFWRAVPPVVGDLTAAPGVRLALGVGEAPIGLQGTFSLWENPSALTDFAYRSAGHVSAIRETGPQRWYAEELFARFGVESVIGTYRGITP